MGGAHKKRADMTPEERERACKYYRDRYARLGRYTVKGKRISIASLPLELQQAMRARANASSKAAYARMTPAQKKARAKQIRLARHRMTPEQRIAYLQKCLVYLRRWRAKQSDTWFKDLAARQKAYWQSLSPERRAKKNHDCWVRHIQTKSFDAAVRLMAWAEKQTEKETT